MENFTFTLQLLEGDVPSQTSALYKFCELMQYQIHRIDDEYGDGFVVQLPEDKVLFCHAVNALGAYCHLHKIAIALKSSE